MIQVNIWDQITTFFNILKNNQYILYLSLIAIVSLLILLLADKFKNKKITKILCILVYVAIFITLFYFYHKQIFKLLDYLINNIFLFLFFPNLAVYILVLIIINIIVIKSTFSNKESKLTKNINIIFFVLFNIIFYLIIDNVITNNINVYEQLSIYTNNNLLILIELNMNLFLLWLIVLLIIKITLKISTNLTFQKSINKHLNLEEYRNEFEFEQVKNPEKKEIFPIKEPIMEIGSYNIYNDYVDIEPIKKTVIDTKDSLEDNQIFANNIKELETIKQPYNGLSFSSFNIIDNIKFNNYATAEESDSSLENEFETYYENNYLNNENKYDNNMNLVFQEEKNDYLKNIMDDIKKLKTNQDDKNQIKKIYEEIKLNQKDLTLRDYNYLIDMLIEIKK